MRPRRADSGRPMAPDTRAWVEIDLSALLSNVAALRSFLHPPTRLMAVVKADAYGHGLVPVAVAAQEAGVDWLGVATVAEGVALREADVRLPIALLCAPAPKEAAAALDYALTAMVGDAATLEAIAQAARSRTSAGTPPIHLDIDTGMGRSGVRPELAIALWQAAIDAGLRVTGLTTHFADADGPRRLFTQRQQALFQRTRRHLERAGARFELVHCSASAAMLRFPDAGGNPGGELGGKPGGNLSGKLGENWGGNLVRPGLLLYGLRPFLSPLSFSAMPDDNAEAELPADRLPADRLPADRLSADRLSAAELPVLKLQPVLTLKARVATVRALPAGHPISYGATHRLTRPSLVATVLIGYGDGYPRRLSNRGCMLLHGQRAAILGRVCMDQTVVDVTDIPGVIPGAEAVCIGAQGAERIRAEEIADRIGTTVHEITTCLTARLPRHYCVSA